MSNNVGGFGLVVHLIASNTFPVGFAVTQFSDDADPVDMGAVHIGDTAMGLNGDLLRWARATPLPLVLNVIPGSDDDLNLQILADANRVAAGKTGANDEISATVIYPDGSIVNLTGGVITDAQFGRGVSSNGKQKTKTYTFAFENKS